jgi:hypothetical protein
MAGPAVLDRFFPVLLSVNVKNNVAGVTPDFSII